MAALALAGCATSPPPAEVLDRALKATGADRLDSLRYEAAGTGATFGQAYTAGGAWPRITVHGVTRHIDYRAAAMREEIMLSRAEPQGGGGYPLSGQQRNDQYLSGELAWNLAGTNVTPGGRFVAERIHQLWVTPHGALKAAQRHGATAARGEDGGSAIAFTVPGRLAATVHVGADGLVRRIDSTFPDPVMGDTRAVTRYGDWRDAGGGVRFPMRIEQSVGGHPTLALAVTAVQPNAPVSLPVPDAARDTTERVTADVAAPGVWFLGGGSHNSVLIEQTDHLILVEAPLGDARSQAVIDRAKALVPNKPIRWLVNSHPHFDHAGGLRTAVAEGATIVTHQANVPWLERLFAQPNSVRPDAMARAGKPPRLRGVGDRADIGDAARPVELHRITGGPHHDGMVMVWLPRERLLIEADAFTPPPPNTPPPAVPNANNVNLVENIERLKLPVDRILPLHGRVVPLAALYEATGRTPPR
ncbi:MBL fold metallo-hydrolase [Aquabacterium sp. J223]|uniref:MBL fold metallo-hydrolase n=1 Tax=Aquabacterium sp. J223 TaxID=2898431 RepID=UPI0021ADAF17|nr:MBL fold metallo-hydrolase [Aquabacterium sp. J223]UUX94721.1 MBL fold metallo-hydrolase [Aquabacterium sp. J223]